MSEALSRKASGACQINGVVHKAGSCVELHRPQGKRSSFSSRRQAFLSRHAANHVRQSRRAVQSLRAYGERLRAGAPASKRSSPHCRWCTSHASGSRHRCCRPRPVCHLWTWLCSSCSCEVHALAASALLHKSHLPAAQCGDHAHMGHGSMGCKRGNGHLNVVCPTNRDLPGARYHQPARHQRAAVPLLVVLGCASATGYAGRPSPSRGGAHRLAAQEVVKQFG